MTSRVPLLGTVVLLSDASLVFSGLFAALMQHDGTGVVRAKFKRHRGVRYAIQPRRASEGRAPAQWPLLQCRRSV